MDNQEQYPQRNNTPVSVGEWIITMIIMWIPLVNFIMLFVWAFSDSTPVSKANWAKATLIVMAAGIILTIVFWGSIAAIIGLSR